MLKKQTKIKKHYKKKVSKPLKKTLSIKKIERYKRVRKSFKLTSTLFNPTYKFLNKFSLKKALTINIKIKPNNVFCTLKQKDKTLYILSAGKSIINNVSKKNIRYKSQLIIKEFFIKIQKLLKGKNFYINLAGAKKMRRLTLRSISNYFKNKKVVINVDLKKCFNGCRAPKKRRKRQRELKIFK